MLFGTTSGVSVELKAVGFKPPCSDLKTVPGYRREEVDNGSRRLTVG